jgi:hypothetical protein
MGLILHHHRCRHRKTTVTAIKSAAIAVKDVLSVPNSDRKPIMGGPRKNPI